MKPKSRDKTSRYSSTWLWKAAALAPVLALGAWLGLTLVNRANVPEDFPKLPDVKPLSTGLRDLLGGYPSEGLCPRGSARAALFKHLRVHLRK